MRYSEGGLYASWQLLHALLSESYASVAAAKLPSPADFRDSRGELAPLARELHRVRRVALLVEVPLGPVQAVANELGVRHGRSASPFEASADSSSLFASSTSCIVFLSKSLRSMLPNTTPLTRERGDPREEFPTERTRQ